MALVLSGDGSITGNPNITLTENVSIAGTVTYEDVTNVDSIGIVTARSGINVTGGSLDVQGNATITGTLVASNGNITSEVDLTGISSSISDTATDVFVYDTSRDSDGGAWRKRTQHTSWYNETLGTATRGSRKEFPAVAVIVAESDTVTIYDGDDPDLPMWMVFEANTDNDDLFINDSSSTLTSIAALNGRIFAGSTRTSTTGNITGIDFVGDRGGMVYTSSSDIRTYRSGIGKRNDGVGNNGSTSNWFTNNPIVNRNVNDVAMTVLPNALIDDATGLPIPTIAVATQGGVSVIKDDGSVVDIANGNGAVYDNSNFISFNSYHQLVFDFDSSKRIIRTFDIPSSDDSIAQWSASSDTGATIVGNAWVGSSNALAAPDVDRYGGLVTLPDGGVGRTSTGMLIWDENKSSPDTKSLGCYISSSYNTGWMHGDIKGAFLSDTDTTNVTGSNLIDNGDFGTGDFTNWSTSGTTAPTISSGGALLTTGAADGAIWQSTSGEATSGKWNISWTVTSNSGGFFGLLLNNNGANGSGGSLVKDSITTSGSYYYEGSITAVEFRHRGASSGIIDNITLRRVGDEDRSVNNQGLQVFGTITKSPVATGAELVAYSGFSGSNYLQQPYNSDLVAGTGSQCFMGWVYATLDGTRRDLFSIGESDANEQFRLGLEDGYAYFDYGNGNAYSRWDTNYIPNNVWTFVVATISAGDEYGKLYINGDDKGIPTAHPTDAPATFLTSTSYTLTIGNQNGTSGNHWNGSLALLRYSHTIPSAAQVKKMYEDEKFLFQENAKATLYGSSDAVTALAYDEVTDQLHVGTSSGRSDFQGLRRINNTTQQVQTAISAHDTFIIEQ